MEIPEKYREINRRKAINIVAKAKEKIKENQSIKNELFVLKETYNYLKNNHPEERKIISILEEVIPEFNDYQEKLKEEKRQKINIKLKRQKSLEYKKAWLRKSAVFRIIHRKMDPKKNDFLQMSETDTEEIFKKIEGKKK